MTNSVVTKRCSKFILTNKVLINNAVIGKLNNPINRIDGSKIRFQLLVLPNILYIKPQFPTIVKKIEGLYLHCIVRDTCSSGFHAPMWEPMPRCSGVTKRWSMGTRKANKLNAAFTVTLNAQFVSCHLMVTLFCFLAEPAQHHCVAH